MQPTEMDMEFALILGHKVEVERAVPNCSCGWKPGSRYILPWDQLANHVWTVIFEAKELRARRLGAEICLPCKGTGRSLIESSHCDVCQGSGFRIDNEEVGKRRQLAVSLGHEPEKDRMGCVCGDTSPWDRHAMKVAQAKLQELEDFERELHGQSRA
jgi:hypothetical protein